MAFIPGPLLVTLPVVGQVYADSAETSSSMETFERVEFDNDRLRAARTRGGVLPQIVTLIGGLQGQILYPEITDFTRPLDPNSYPGDWSNIKKNLYIQKATITFGSMTNSMSPNIDIQALANACEADQEIIRKFYNRIAIAGDTNLSYEDMVALQADNPAGYLTGGNSLGTVSLQVPPSGGTGNIVLVGSTSFLVNYRQATLGLVANIGLGGGAQLTWQSFDITSGY